MVGDEWTSWTYADVELGGGRLVVGISEAVAYAGAVDDVVHELDTRIGGRCEGGNDEGAEGERGGKGFSVCVETVERGRVAIKQGKEKY